MQEGINDGHNGIGISTVDWPKAIRELHDITELSWRRMAAHLGVGEDQLSKARRDRHSPGQVLAGRLIAMAIEFGVVTQVFNTETLKRAVPRLRYSIGLPHRMSKAEDGEGEVSDEPE